MSGDYCNLIWLNVMLYLMVFHIQINVDMWCYFKHSVNEMITNDFWIVLIVVSEK